MNHLPLLPVLLPHLLLALLPPVLLPHLLLVLLPRLLLVLLPLLLLVLHSVLLRAPTRGAAGGALPADGNRRLGWVLGLALWLPSLAVLGYVASRLPTMAGTYWLRPFTLSERLASEAVILWEYLRVAFLPRLADLSPFHDDYPVRHFSDGVVQLALAAWADVLVCATPGGAATKHMVNAQVLQALGPQGYLINIARGSVVDTEALAAALKSGTIAGAGIDVYESEPHRPEALVDLPNILITPHVAGWSPEATQASVAQFIGNLTGVFAGKGAVAPVDLG